MTGETGPVDADELRAAVADYNAGDGGHSREDILREVANATPVLYISIGRPRGDRNCRRGWTAQWCLAVEWPDGHFAVAEDFQERYLKRFQAAQSGPDAAAQAFRRQATALGVPLRIHDGRH